MSLEDSNTYTLGSFFIALASIFIAGKVVSSIFVKFKQPEVLGELIAGVLLGVLGLIPLYGEVGYHFFHLLAEIGVAILLFEIPCFQIFHDNFGALNINGKNVSMHHNQAYFM